MLSEWFDCSYSNVWVMNLVWIKKNEFQKSLVFLFTPPLLFPKLDHLQFSILWFQIFIAYHLDCPRSFWSPILASFCPFNQSIDDIFVWFAAVKHPLYLPFAFGHCFVGLNVLMDHSRDSLLIRTILKPVWIHENKLQQLYDLFFRPSRVSFPFCPPNIFISWKFHGLSAKF